MNVMKPLIAQLTKMIKEGYDLGKRELPEVGKQILRFYLWVNILQSTVCTVASLLFAKWGWLFMQTILDYKSHGMFDDCDGRYIGVFILGITSLVFAGFVYDGLYTILKIALAPKLFLLDALASYL